MTESQAIELVKAYIHKRTGKRVRISLFKIVGDARQSMLLEKAVKHIQEYYKDTENPF